jgi:uncharacterized protein YbjT (DUF2867 family)
MKKILVIGGTGLLGRPVGRQLSLDGHSVRLMARDPGSVRSEYGGEFEVVGGDVTDLASLEAAMRGCDGVHLSVGGQVDRLSAENVSRLAPAANVQRITYLSGSTVAEANGWFPMVAQKLAAEKALMDGDTAYTIFCPTWPMEQLPRFVIEGRATVIGEQATALHWFAAADLARMVSAAYGKEEAANKRLYVHGPQGLTMKQALERYCAAIRPDVGSVDVIPIDAARAAAESTDNPVLAFMAEMMSYFDQAGEPGDPSEANELLGAPTTTLDEWLAAASREAGQ